MLKKTLALFLLLTGFAEAQSYTQPFFGIDKTASPPVMYQLLNGSWQRFPASSDMPAFTGDCVTSAGSTVISCAPLLAKVNTWSNTNLWSDSNTFYDATAYRFSANSVLAVGPGANIGFCGLAGCLVGNPSRTSLYKYDASKFNATKEEYVNDFEFYVSTGKAETWAVSSSYISNVYIHSYGSGQDGLYQMTGGTSPCTSAAVGSGPAGLVVGGTSVDNTCAWTYIGNGISDGKALHTNTLWVGSDAGHSWLSADNTIINAHLYNGALFVNREADYTLNNSENCAIGYVNCYVHFDTGVTRGTATAIYSGDQIVYEAPVWAATTTLPPFSYRYKNDGGTDRLYVLLNTQECTTGGTGPSGTGASADGTCNWYYKRDGRTPYGSHYWALLSNANYIEDALIGDGTSARYGIRFFGQHVGADFDAASYQTAAGTPYFAQLPVGQRICFNAASDCILSTTYSGSSVLQFTQSGAIGLNLLNPASTVNFIQLQGNATGFGPVVQSAGSDANVPLNLQAKSSDIQLLSPVYIIASTLKMNGGTSSFFSQGNAGLGGPGTAGEKIQLYGVLGAPAATDYSIGVESGFTWFSTGGGYRFYGFTSNVLASITAAGGVQSSVTTVGALPTCNAAAKATRLYVSDANATLTAGIGAVVAAGGANNVPVGCDGTNWRIGG